MATLIKLLLVILAAFLQDTNFFNLFGIKPNFSLAVLTAVIVAGAALNEFLVLALISAVLLKFKPGFDAGALAFAVTALAAFAAHRYLPWSRYLNNAVLIAGATLLLQILLMPARITALEVVYNLILSTIILTVLPKSNHELANKH